MSATQETRIEWTGNIQVHHPATVHTAASETAATGDLDFCYVCDKDAVWRGEHCTGCHREWGYEHPPKTCPTCPASAGA